jgi:hypothetical protein
LVQRVLGCWQHDLSRPFSHRGEPIGFASSAAWPAISTQKTGETHGPSYRLPANTGYVHSVSMIKKAA